MSTVLRQFSQRLRFALGRSGRKEHFSVKGVVFVSSSLFVVAPKRQENKTPLAPTTYSGKAQTCLSSYVARMNSGYWLLAMRLPWLLPRTVSVYGIGVATTNIQKLKVIHYHLTIIPDFVHPIRFCSVGIKQCLQWEICYRI
jgi:hypothetical protein